VTQLILTQRVGSRSHEQRDEGPEIASAIVDRCRREEQDPGTPRQIRQRCITLAAGIPRVMGFVEHQQRRPFHDHRLPAAQRLIRLDASVHSGAPQCLAPHLSQRGRRDDQHRRHDARHRNRHECLAHSRRVSQHSTAPPA